MKNEVLVLVHPEQSYVKIAPIRASKVINRIIKEVDTRLERGEPVYCMVGCHGPDRLAMGLVDRKNSLKIIGVPDNFGFGTQFLVSKDRLLREGIEEVLVAGFARLECVEATRSLYLGQVKDEKTRSSYVESGQKCLGISLEEATALVDFKMQVRVDETMSL